MGRTVYPHLVDASKHCRRWDDRVHIRHTVVGVPKVHTTWWSRIIKGVKNWFLSIVVAFIVINIFIFAWSYVYSEHFPAVDFNTDLPGEFRPQIIFQGESPSLCRKFTILRDNDLYINRSLVSTSYSEPNIIIDLGSTVVSRSLGEVYQCRIVQIPHDIPPGDYVMKVGVSYKSWPFWERHIDAPDAELTILPK